jgi:hypothetical protein
MIRKSGYRFSEEIMLKSITENAMTAHPGDRVLGASGTI